MEAPRYFCQLDVPGQGKGAVDQRIVPKETRLHILGFAKANEIESFAPLGITSFDTTSPLIRAFKDAKANYYLARRRWPLAYYTAIRVPQALENTKLLRLAKRGVL